jgi:hypothetical protein
MVRQTMDLRPELVDTAVACTPRGGVPARHWRAGSGLVLTTAVAHAAGSRAFVDGRRHLDDDGDDWRSLLFGAPPARA